MDLHDSRGRILILNDAVLTKHSAAGWDEWCSSGRVLSSARIDGYVGCDIKLEAKNSAHTVCDRYHQIGILFKWERNLLKIPEGIITDPKLIDAFLVLSGLREPSDGRDT